MYRLAESDKGRNFETAKETALTARNDKTQQFWKCFNRQTLKMFYIVNVGLEYDRNHLIGGQHRGRQIPSCGAKYAIHEVEVLTSLALSSALPVDRPCQFGANVPITNI